MSTVYLATRDDGAFRQEVAIKVSRWGFDDAEVDRRFRRERQILADLRHPHVARLLDGGTTPHGEPYLVMEYIEGTPVDAYCDRGRLTLRQRLELFREVCSAVHFAHQSLVVHRDLKPANILVTPDGRPKLVDFGIAKLLESTHAPTVAATLTEHRPFTPRYASPEQIVGAPITTSSDVYSLGVLLYELLAGLPPHDLTDLSRREVERLIAEVDPPRPSLAVARTARSAERPGVGVDEIAVRRRTTAERLPSLLKDDLDHIVMKALRKEPDHRYGSVEQLSEDIRRHLLGLPVTARQGTLGYLAWKLLKRHRLAVGFAAAVLLLLLVSGILMAVQAAQIARQRDRAELERDKARQVSSFLVEIFEDVDPDQVRGDTLTAREILARGVERIDRLDDQPEAQATLREAIGRVYLNLGIYDEAERLLGQALAGRRALAAADDPELRRLEESYAAVRRRLDSEGRGRRRVSSAGDRPASP